MYFYMILGLFLITLGLTKILIYLLSLPIINSNRHWIQNKRIWVLIGDDVSMTGRVIDLVVVVLGVVSLLRGLELINRPLHPRVSEVINTRHFVYFLYGILGTFLVIFFYIALYTDIKIDKDPRYEVRYKFIGFCLGTLFITIVPIMMFAHLCFDHGIVNGFMKHPWYSSACIAVIAVLLSILTWFTKNIILERRKNDKHIAIIDYVSLFMIPLNTF